MLMNHFISAESLPDLIILIAVVNQKGKYARSRYRMRREILVAWLFQCVLPLGVSLRNMPQDIISCIAAVPWNQFRAIILLQRQTYIKRLCSHSLDILLTISRVPLKVVIPRYSVMSWNRLPLASLFKQHLKKKSHYIVLTKQHPEFMLSIDCQIMIKIMICLYDVICTLINYLN